MYLLGYLASQSKVYLMDKDFSVGVLGYQMSLSCSLQAYRPVA